MRRQLSAIALAIAMLLAGAYLAFHLHQEVKKQILFRFGKSQLLIARQVAEEIKSYLVARSQDLRHIASLTSLLHLDVMMMPDDMRISLEHLKGAQVEDIFILDTEGNIVYSITDDVTGTSYSRSFVSAWAKEPSSKGMVRLAVEQSGKKSTSASGKSLEPQRTRLSMVTPLYHRESDAGGFYRPGGMFAGTLVVTVDLEALAKQAFMFTPTTESNALPIWIMDDEGALLLHSQHPEMVVQNVHKRSEECNQCHGSFDYAEKILTAKQGTLEYQLKGHEGKVAAFAPVTVENVSWIVVVNTPKNEVTGFIEADFAKTFGLFGFVGLVLAIAFFFIYRSSGQEMVIAEKARHLQEKELLVEKLRETSDYLENLFDSANAPIIVWNPELRVMRFNRAFERLTGYTAGEIIGRELRMLFPEESREESLSKIAYTSGGEDRDAAEIPILRKDGEIRIVLWNSANIRTGDRAAVIATIAQGLDITERKQAEQMKADFVTFVTHQLRTPLSGIRWLLELVGQEEGVPEEAASLVTDARAAAERLILLVNDLLAVARIEGGRLAVRPERVNLAGVTSDVVSELTPQVHEKNHQISVSDGISAPLVYADPQLVREVVLNLLSNAIKYTPQDGSITVSMKAGGDMVEWAVHDTGIGVSLDAQRHLFEKFYRAENATVVNTEGTGLGLYLVKLVVERSGGRVWCESGEGQGSRFAFTLPMARPAAQDEGRTTP